MSVLPSYSKPSEICRKLRISRRALKRWEVKEVIPFTAVGPAHRYAPAKVEAALRKHRFGPNLSPLLDGDHLRDRVTPEEICERLGISRKTLQRRMEDGLVPFYRIGQTYRLAPDEVGYALANPVSTVPELADGPMESAQ